MSYANDALFNASAYDALKIAFYGKTALYASPTYLMPDPLTYSKGVTTSSNGDRHSYLTTRGFFFLRPNVPKFLSNFYDFGNAASYSYFYFLTAYSAKSPNYANGAANLSFIFSRSCFFALWYSSLYGVSTFCNGSVDFFSSSYNGVGNGHFVAFFWPPLTSSSNGDGPYANLGATSYVF